LGASPRFRRESWRSGWWGGSWRSGGRRCLLRLGYRRGDRRLGRLARNYGENCYGENRNATGHRVPHSRGVGWLRSANSTPRAGECKRRGRVRIGRERRRLTASRFAKHPCGGAARPANASIALKPNTRLAGIGRRSPALTGRSPRRAAPVGRRPGRGCFAKRSRGGSSELLGAGWGVHMEVTGGRLGYWGERCCTIWEELWWTAGEAVGPIRQRANVCGKRRRAGPSRPRQRGPRV